MSGFRAWPQVLRPITTVDFGRSRASYSAEGYPVKERIFPSGSLNYTALSPLGAVQIPSSRSWMKGFFNCDSFLFKPDRRRSDVFYLPPENGALLWQEIRDLRDSHQVAANPHEQCIWVARHEFKAQFTLIKTPRVVIDSHLSVQSRSASLNATRVPPPGYCYPGDI